MHSTKFLIAQLHERQQYLHVSGHQICALSFPSVFIACCTIAHVMSMPPDSHKPSITVLEHVNLSQLAIRGRHSVDFPLICWRRLAAVAASMTTRYYALVAGGHMGTAALADLYRDDSVCATASCCMHDYSACAQYPLRHHHSVFGQLVRPQ